MSITKRHILTGAAILTAGTALIIQQKNSETKPLSLDKPDPAYTQKSATLVSVPAEETEEEKLAYSAAAFKKNTLIKDYENIHTSAKIGHDGRMTITLSISEKKPIPNSDDFNFCGIGAQQLFYFTPDKIGQGVGISDAHERSNTGAKYSQRDADHFRNSLNGIKKICAKYDELEFRAPAKIQVIGSGCAL